MKTISNKQALSRLAAYCSRSERCLQDILKKLDQWEVSLQDQSQIIRFLEKENFLDETRYASAFVRDKFRFNGWGVRRIQLEMKKKNIPSEIIEKALGEISAEENITSLIDLLKKKQKSVKAKNEFEAKQKLMRFAAGRGFLLDDIEKAMNRIK